MISTVSGNFWIFSRRLSYLSFPSTSTFVLNECARHKVTQSSYQIVWIHTFWYYQLFHFVLTCMESLSHFVALHSLLNNGVNHQMIPFFSNWGLQSNYQVNQTCVWVSQCHWQVTFLQEQILVIHTSGHLKGHSQKHWKCFLHKFVKSSTVECACFNSSDMMREHIGMGLERSSKRHLQSW